MRHILAGIATLTLILLAGCGSGSSSSSSATNAAASSQSASSQKTVNLELDYVPNPDDMGLYYAMSHGYFAKEGLTVEPHSPANIDTPLRLVATGSVELALSYEPELYAAKAEGLPVVAVASVIPVPLTCIASLQAKGLSTAASLKGKTIAVDGTQTDSAILAGVLRSAGLSVGDVKVVSASANGVQDVLAGRVDADAAAFINYDAVEIQEADSGRKPNCIKITQAGVPTFDEIVVVANSERLASDPAYAATVRKFVAGLVSGTKATLTDRAGAEASIGKVAGLKPAFLKQSVNATFGVLTPPSGRPIGCLSQALWTSYGEWALKNKLIGKLPPVDTVMTDSYLPNSC
jgi:putative hydroxymethylpyrimidine transport system substrate-binding protein